MEYSKNVFRMFSCFLSNQLNTLMLLQIARLGSSYNWFDPRVTVYSMSITNIEKSLEYT